MLMKCSKRALLPVKMNVVVASKGGLHSEAVHDAHLLPHYDTPSPLLLLLHLEPTAGVLELGTGGVRGGGVRGNS